MHNNTASLDDRCVNGLFCPDHDVVDVPASRAEREALEQYVAQNWPDPRSQPLVRQYLGLADPAPKPTIPQWDVTLGWIGSRAKVVTVPTFLGAEAAERRARLFMMQQSPRRNID